MRLPYLMKKNHRNRFLVIGITDPMTSVEKILLGRITKLYGFEGAVTIKLESNFSEDVDDTGPVFLEIEGRPVPFFPEYIEPAGPGFIRMKFDWYDKAEQVREFIGCSVFTTDQKQIPRENDDQLQSLMGFEVFSEGENIGRVTEIIQNPGQIIIRLVSGSGKELLIPLHEDLIDEIDQDLKTLKMILPEGLTELN